MQSDYVSDAAFVAGAGQAEPKGAPSCALPSDSLQGASGASVWARWRSLHARYAEQCKWDAAAKDLSTEFLDSRNGLLGAQQLVARKGDDACHADMLSSFDLNTTRGSAAMPGSVARPSLLPKHRAHFVTADKVAPLAYYKGGRSERGHPVSRR